MVLYHFSLISEQYPTSLLPFIAFLFFFLTYFPPLLFLNRAVAPYCLSPVSLLAQSHHSTSIQFSPSDLFESLSYTLTDIHPESDNVIVPEKLEHLQQSTGLVPHS
jgi:hypothetical protein